MSTKIQSGNNSAGLQNVDSNYNGQVNLPYTKPDGSPQGGGESTSGFATMLTERDSGSITGTRDVYAPEVTSNYRLRVGTDQTLFNEIFPGAALNTTLWTSPVTTSTIAVAGNSLTLNNGASLASGAVARVTSYRSFPVLFTYPLYASMTVQFSATPVANSVHEWGMFISTGVTAPTDGAYFTINASSELRAVVNTNGTINQSGILNFSNLIGINQARYFLIYIGIDNVTFWIDNVKVFESNLSGVSSLGLQVGSGQLPVSFRSYNSNTVTGTACLMKVSSCNISLSETSSSKPWSQIVAGAGGSLYQGQTGQTLGTLALYSNSLAAGAGAVMTNTTAALGSGLGGQFSTQPTLAAGTDGIVCSYQVPAGTVTAPGKSLYITGIRIQGAVTTVLANAAAVIYAYSLAYGHNAVSLATATSATSKAPTRVAIGLESYAINAAVGTLGQGLSITFTTPIVVYPSEFVQIVAKNIGTVTSSGVITFLVTFDGYFE